MNFTSCKLTSSLTRFFSAGWPPFIWNDPIMQTVWPKWFEYFPEYQFVLKINRKIAACVNAVPLNWTESLQSLPDGQETIESGWDWVMQKSIEDFQLHKKPNLLSAAAIVVAPEFQGQGIASAAVEHLKQVSKQAGFKALIAPLRPSKKRDYPNLEIDEYMELKLPGTDLPLDPWLRLHVKAGGRIIKSCVESIVISAPLDKWTQWTNVQFDKSGLYTIPGGDEQLIVDLEENCGDYAASGVWVVHQ